MDLLIKQSETGGDLTDDDIREEVDTVMFAVSALLDCIRDFYVSNGIFSANPNERGAASIIV